MSETTVKSTRGRRSTAKPIDEVTTVTAKEVETVVPEVKEEIKKSSTVKYDIKPDELIPCRSIVVGKYLLIGKKTKIQYRWEDNGDMQYVEYQDLLAEMITSSNAVYAPFIMIEDDRILDDYRWKKIADLYEKMAGNEDIEALLDLPVEKFETILANAPKGLQRAVKTVVATKLANKTFDSIHRVEIIDKICGTDFTCLLGR